MLINVFRDITYGEEYVYSVSYGEFVATIEKDDLEKFMLPIIEKYEKENSSFFYEGDRVKYFYVEHKIGVDYSNSTSGLVKTYF